MPAFTVGQTVEYTFYGKPETATIVHVGIGSILLLSSGRWMHKTSCTLVEAQ